MHFPQVTHTFVKDMRSWGPIALTLHGRTRQQRYSKLADWQYITNCAEVGVRLKMKHRSGCVCHYFLSSSWA